MEAVLSLIFIFLMPFPAIAHPGKTDYRGGHKCWKNCGEWDLIQGEYHLHDRDGKPIRLAPKTSVTEIGQTKVVPTPDKRFLLEEVSPLTKVRERSATRMPDQNAAAEKHQTLRDHEESVLPFNSILLLLLALLMLMVLVFVRKKREKK